MRIVPDSTVSLYAGVEIDNGEQLAFSSKANQTAYFQSKLVRQAVNCTMVRKTGALRLEAPGSVVSGCNYISFINPSFDNKIVYARIVDYDYVNNECVEITYMIDYWQTWMFDVSFESCHIEREHLSAADYAKADINPYDPTIFELRTAEDLPIGKDLEKAAYTIGTGQNDDGSKLGDIVNIDPHLGVLIKLSNIDFKSLDDQVIVLADKPGYQFSAYLSTLVGSTRGEYSFYYLPQGMYDYLSTTYPSFFPTNPSTGVALSRGALNSGWVTQSGTVYPFYGSSYRPQCCYIYDSLGGEMSGNSMGTILTLITGISGGDPSTVVIDMTLIPNNFMFLGGRLDDGTQLASLQFGIRAAKNLNVMSHKLMRYPFAYGRLISPNGDIKEFRFEDFINIQNNEDIGYMAMLMDISDRPVFIIAPVNYKINGENDENTNVLEGLFFNQFPTMPYTIDAFNAQIAAVANDTIANRTTEYDYNLNLRRELVGDVAEANDFTGWLGGVGAAIADVFGGGAGTSATGLGASAFTKSKEYEMGRKIVNEEWKRNVNATDTMTQLEGSEIAKQLKMTKPAFACDKYFPSNGIGTTNFTVVSFCDIISLCVNLQPMILEQYDLFFALYGYNSGRCGIPRICNYVAGSTTQTDIPTWINVDGHDITYIKTMDCKVKHPMIPVESYIKSMFDGGVRMIKGDLS